MIKSLDVPSATSRVLDVLELIVVGFVAVPWGGWALELGARRSLRGDGRDLRLAAGVVVALSEDWEIGLGVALGLDGAAQDALLTTLSFED